MKPRKKKTRTDSPVVRDWSGLPPELLMIIAKFTMSASVDTSSLNAFGGDCKSWRAVTKDDELAKFRSWAGFPAVLMLPAGKRGTSEFFSASNGWLLTLGVLPNQDGDVQVELLEPLSGFRVKIDNKLKF